ncbi:hypothetical protein AABM34_18110 [Lysinibacillus fusiformis]
MDLTEVQLVLNNIIAGSESYFPNYISEEFSSNCSEGVWDGFNGDFYLKDHIIKKGLAGKTIATKEELILTYENLLQGILDDFLGKHLSNKAMVIVILYNFKKYNSLAEFLTLGRMYGEVITSNNSFIKRMNNILDEYERLDGGIAIKFKDIELFLAQQKVGIEILLETIIDTTWVEGEITFDYVYEDLTLLVNEIGLLTIAKDFVISNIFNAQLRFSKEGYLIVDTPSTELENLNEVKINNIKWLAEKENDKFIIPENYIRRLNRIVKVRTGLDIEGLKGLRNSIGNTNDSWRVLDMPKIEAYFRTHLPNITEDELTRLLNLLIRNEEVFDIKRFHNTHRNSRITLNPIVPLFYNFYIFSDNVLIETLDYLSKKVFDSNFYEGNLKGQFETINNKINNSFVEDVKLKLESAGIENILIHVEYIKGISGNLPNEIDLIALKGNCVYIIECKNFLFKSDFKAIRSEISKTKGEFTKKLDIKVDSIRNNLKDLLKNEFDIDDFEKYEDNVKGIFITNNFSFTSSYKGKGYESINYTEIVNYFKEE